MHKTWDPQQPVETFFKQIQYCVDYAEVEGIPIIEMQNLTTAYAKVVFTGNFHSACRRWNERNPQDNTWKVSKSMLIWPALSTSKCRANQ
jgi:hypothetical protein